MAKVYDETYTVEIFTEDGQRWVNCFHGGIGITTSFKTREELNKIIGDYIEDADKGEEYTQGLGI